MDLGSPKYGSLKNHRERTVASSGYQHLLVDPLTSISVSVDRYGKLSIPGRTYLVYELEVSVSRKNQILQQWRIYRKDQAFWRLCDDLDNAISIPRSHRRAATKGKGQSHPFCCTRGSILQQWLDEVLFKHKQALLHENEWALIDFLSRDMNTRPEGLGKLYTIATASENVDPNTPQGNLKNSLVGIREQRKGPSLSDYKMVKVVGQGSFGQVVIARVPQPLMLGCSGNTKDNIVAIKVLNKANMIKRSQGSRVEVERLCLEQTSSPFIVKLFGAYQNDTQLFFIQEYCPAGEMYFHLEKTGRFSNQLSRFYAAECILAIEHLHSLSIIYRDLKPENLMLDAQGHIKLVDFGLAKVGFSSSLTGATSYVGTTEYLSPEMILKKGHGQSVDWWALGMLLYEMLTGLPPWYSEEKQEVLYGILHEPLRRSSKLTRESLDLLLGLLQKSPAVRLGSGPSKAAEIKAHPYFVNISWEALSQKRVIPPFVPNVTSQVDVSYFDKKFTNLSVNVVNTAITAEERDTIEAADKKGVFSNFVRTTESLGGAEALIKPQHLQDSRVYYVQ